jgi:hypothetical protein
MASISPVITTLSLSEADTTVVSRQLGRAFSNKRDMFSLRKRGFHAVIKLSTAWDRNRRAEGRGRDPLHSHEGTVSPATVARERKRRVASTAPGISIFSTRAATLTTPYNV